MKTRLKIVSLLAMIATPQAYGYDEHSDWSWNRNSSYRGSYQYITETQAVNASTLLTSKSLDQFDEQVENQQAQSFRGSAVKIGAGIELVRFVRFEAYSLHKDLSENLNSSLRGVEVGGTASVSFYGPVVNIQFGLGLLGSRLHKQSQTEGSIYYGTGYAGILSFEKFIARRASVLFSIKGSEQSFSSERQSFESKLEMKEISAGFALVLWI